jgi:hypothetical protein
LINSFEWSELAQEWRNHKFSYLENQKVLRNQNIQFGQNSLMPSIVDGPFKTILQLNKIFNSETVDLIHVSERIKAALITFETDGRFGFRNPVETRRGEAHQKVKAFMTN